MVVLHFFQGLAESYKARLRARQNTRAVAHLSDDQLLDIGLYRAGDHIKTINKPLTEVMEPTANIHEPERIIDPSERIDSLEVDLQSKQLSGAD